MAKPMELVLPLLQTLIALPSFSKEEGQTAEAIERHLQENGVETQRLLNNVWALNRHFHPAKPTLLLNSHHDTVKPNAGYTRNPHAPTLENGKLFGLGSNDAGGALACLLACFLHFYDKENLAYNLVFAATAEEEISGKNGIEALWPKLPHIDVALVGEPTEMQLAIAEKGLMVVDVAVRGEAGHAARREGKNAIYEALPLLNWLASYQFEQVSPTLGPVLMQVSQINAGYQHNVVPDLCTFVLDIRLNECYRHEEVLGLLQNQFPQASFTARSTRLKPSFIPENHPMVKAGKSLGRKVYGSPTLSDQALMPCPSLKIGPGRSERSHSSDEFIYLAELEEGYALYVELLNRFFDQVPV